MMDNEFGQWLLRFRTDQNLTQWEIATDIGSSASSISQWERGVSRPIPVLWERIAFLAEQYGHEAPPAVARRRGPVMVGASG